MIRRHIIITSLLMPVLSCGTGLCKEAAKIKLNLETAHHGTPEIDLAMLETSHPDAKTKAFFIEARKLFQNHPQSTFADLTELRDAAKRNGLTHLGGPMLGALSQDGARVWLRTVDPAEVTVVVDDNGKERHFGPVASTVESDLSAVVPVTGLKPGTRYPYHVLVNGKAISMPADAAITTALEAPGKMQIAFGADFHKTGLWNRPLLDQIRTRGNRAMLLLGDNAVDDRTNRVGLHRSDYLLRDLSPAWRELAANASIYATWDDHDYFNNDKSGIPKNFTAADRAAVRTVWTQNWNNPGYGQAGQNEGIYFRSRIGPCDVIMLDTRFFRSAKMEPDSYLGTTQMQWLEEQLLSCTGPFIILTSGTMWSDDISDGKDSWGVWDPEGRERIFSLIEKHHIGGVILLSGDRHGARVIKIPRPSGFTFWEFELGSLGAHRGPGAMGSHPENQPFGKTVQPLFGECAFDTTTDDPTVTVRIIDAKGDTPYEVTLTRSQLTP